MKLKNKIITFLIVVAFSLMFTHKIHAEFIGALGSVNPETTVTLVDEFMGSIENGEIGNLGWSFFGTSAVLSNISSIWSANNPGIKRLATEAVINSPAVLLLSSSVTGTIVDADNLFDVTYVIQLPSVAGLTYRVGIANDFTNYAAMTDGAWFVFTTTATGQENAAMSITKWVTVTRSGGTVTYNNTTIANTTATTTYKLRIVRTTASAIDFYIDGILMFTHTANLPTINVIPGLYIESQTAVTSKTFEIDYFKLKINGLAR